LPKNVRAIVDAISFEEVKPFFSKVCLTLLKKGFTSCLDDWQEEVRERERLVREVSSGGAQVREKRVYF